jgi:arsenical pump membrane protein
MSIQALTWTVAALAIAGVILRPFNLPEAIWAMAGAVLLIVLGLISIPDALTGVAKGTDVYLFLFGMMILSAWIFILRLTGGGYSALL